MRISEIFSSIQGEGIWLGMPSVFIRVAGCNLRCSWCDTARARRLGGARTMSVEEVVQGAGFWKTRHVVITGGEPTLYGKELIELCQALREKGKVITVESNATTYVGCGADLMSLSPKLRAWHQDVLERYCEQAEKVQLKLVAGHAEEAERLWERVKDLQVPAERVFIMPRARTRAEHMRRGKELVEWCIEHRVRFAVRAQTLLWNNKGGR
ncbi:MAG: 7-carboxy-7-deazaguanine synthase QueE [bacterium]|nr:7-carboxy-7-deazaguanine synthase QueE [bacterium]